MIDFKKTKFKFKLIDFEKAKFKFKFIDFAKSNLNSNSSITRERIQIQNSKFKFNLTLRANGASRIFEKGAMKFENNVEEQKIKKLIKRCKL